MANSGNANVGGESQATHVPHGDLLKTLGFDVKCHDSTRNTTAAKHVSYARTHSTKRNVGMKFRASSFLLKFILPLVLLCSPAHGMEDSKADSNAPVASESPSGNTDGTNAQSTTATGKDQCPPIDFSGAVVWVNSTHIFLYPNVSTTLGSVNPRPALSNTASFEKSRARIRLLLDQNQVGISMG
eukprot:740611_1